MSAPTTDNTIYLISGANRGIGLGLVKAVLSSHPSAFVYAGARDVEGATALQSLRENYPERVVIVKCVSADVEGNAALAREIEERHGRLDVVVANAAISNNVGSVIDTPVSIMEDHFQVNVLGPVVLFQTTHNILRKSPRPKFITIGSQAGSIDGITVRHPAIGGVGYGSSKAALNWVTRKIHFENDWLVAFVLAPRLVMTDMFKTASDNDKTGSFASIIHLAADPDVASMEMLTIIDHSTREEHGGEFFNVDGNKAAW